jgi:hypothetical protein
VSGKDVDRTQNLEGGDAQARSNLVVNEIFGPT